MPLKCPADFLEPLACKDCGKQLGLQCYYAFREPVPIADIMTHEERLQWLEAKEPKKVLETSEKKQLKQLRGEVAWCHDKITLFTDALLAKKILLRKDNGELAVSSKRKYKEYI